MNYVIVGNSVAAVGAIRGIRSVDPKGNITVISRERHIAYGRPLISYLLGGLITEKRMAYLPEDFYEDNRVNLLLNSEVVGVDTDKKRVFKISRSKAARVAKKRPARNQILRP